MWDSALYSHVESTCMTAYFHKEERFGSIAMPHFIAWNMAGHVFVCRGIDFYDFSFRFFELFRQYGICFFHSIGFILFLSTLANCLISFVLLFTVKDRFSAVLSLLWLTIECAQQNRQSLHVCVELSLL